MEKVERSAQTGSSSIEQYRQSDVCQELGRIEKILQAQGIYGEEAPAPATVSTSRSSLWGSVSSWLFTSESKSSQINNIQKVRDDVLRCVLTNLEYLKANPDAQVEREMTGRVLGIEVLVNTTETQKLRKLMDSCTNKREQDLVKEKSFDLIDQVTSVVSSFKKDVERMKKMEIFLSSIKDASIWPSGFSIVNAEAKCALVLDGEHETYEFVDQTDDLYKQFDANKQDVRFIASQEEGFKGQLIQFQGKRYCVISPTDLDTLRGGPRKDFSLVDENGSTIFQGHKKIVASESDFFKEQFAEHPDASQIKIPNPPPEFEPAEWQKCCQVVLTSFYTLEPLPIDEKNSQIFRAVGEALKSKLVLEQQLNL